MEEPNKSVLVLLQHEASELLALFDHLRGDDAARCATAHALAGAVALATNSNMQCASLIDAARLAGIEPLRDSRRLQLLRGWSDVPHPE